MTHALLRMAQDRTVLFDGAMGTMLMASGLTSGECPEVWNLEKPSLVMEIHRRYYEAGSDVVHTNTFGGNLIKLSDRGLSGQMEAINLEAARIAREACPQGKFVAGDLGPTGKLFKPLGTLDPHAVEEAYRMQAETLIKGGVDLISIETMFSLQEALAAVRAAKALGQVLVVASMTYNKTKRGYFTMMGEGVKEAISALVDAGADVVGAYCTLGSRDMIDLTKEIRAVTQKPILVQPNAGQPVTREGITIYEQSPLEFARHGKEIKAAGADMIGGCCGTDAAFIGELAKAVL
ncbi:MAG: homocysteine S-methyltransferase family protein [Desulfobacterales bacterium]|nr:homocysteine S-methyltransferase family protein [Desulfobacterales bacterium]